VLDAAGGFSVLQIRLETGRTHQIRIHLAAIGHPLLGEAWYRSPRCSRHGRQALHAFGLSFADPGPPQHLVAPLPQDLLDLAARLGLALPTTPV
jgi:23S rRNA pseudouridine1911/1915/1917 synthase